MKEAKRSMLGFVLLFWGIFSMKAIPNSIGWFFSLFMPGNQFAEWTLISVSASALFIAAGFAVLIANARHEQMFAGFALLIFGLFGAMGLHRAATVLAAAFAPALAVRIEPFAIFAGITVLGGFILMAIGAAIQETQLTQHR